MEDENKESSKFLKEDELEATQKETDSIDIQEEGQQVSILDIFKRDKKIKELETEIEKLNIAFIRQEVSFNKALESLHKEKEAYKESVQHNLLLDFLDIFDNFERALKSFEGIEDFDLKVKEGVNLIHKQIETFLLKMGVKKMGDLVKNLFDPHSQILGEVVLSDENDGVVVDVLRDGYFLNGKVLRPAVVKVTQKKIN